jgi:hypothetical protein
VCTDELADQKSYFLLVTVLYVLLIVAVLVICGIILMIMWRRGLTFCTPRKSVGTYSQVIEPSRAELEWDDRDLEHIWSTSSSRRVP